eukprot:UN29061
MRRVKNIQIIGYRTYRLPSWSFPDHWDASEHWLAGNAFALGTSIIFTEPLIILFKTIFWIALYPCLIGCWFIITCSCLCQNDRETKGDDDLPDVIGEDGVLRKKSSNNRSKGTPGARPTLQSQGSSTISRD